MVFVRALKNVGSSGIKVFGIGLARTGTTSLNAAMRILGYRGKHFLLNPEQDIRESDFVCDMPVQTRYREYDRQYSGSRFILTVRNKGQWLESCRKRFHVAETDTKSVVYKYRMEQFRSAVFDEDKFSKKYDLHYQEAFDYFKHRPNDLLVINITEGQGWRELCAFLSKKIPDQEFPRINASLC